MSDVIDTFERFRMPETAISEWSKGGRDLLAERIAAQMAQSKPLDFVMLGYPIKSTNDRDKTIGKLPDLAEEISWKQFHRFGEEITKVYAPGARLHIVSDGFVFNDLLGATDSTVDAYAEVNRQMIKDADAPVSLYSLRDFFSSDLATAREKLMGQFGITDAELERRILFDPNVNSLYRGMMRFMEEELANRDYPSRNQLHKAAKKLAREMMFRNEAYSQLATHEFAEAIRLSMHPTTNNGKWGFQLIPSEMAWTSPWHCALLVHANGSLETIHRKDAKSCHQLVEMNGRPYCFQEVCHGAD